jgi:hypothetical protein
MQTGKATGNWLLQRISFDMTGLLWYISALFFPQEEGS